MARTSVATEAFSGTLSNFTQMNTVIAGDITIYTGKYAGQFGGNPSGGVNGIACARYTGAGSFNNDQYASAVLSGIQGVGVDYGVGVCCRASGSAGTRTFYGAHVSADHATTPTVYLFKIVNGTYTALATPTAVALVDTDRIELECQGTTIRACKNGTALGGIWTVTDSEIASGAPGLTGGDDGFIYGDDWDAGNLSAAGQSASLGGVALSAISAINGITKASISAVNGLTI